VRGALRTIARRSRAAGVEGPALLVVGEVVTALTGAAVEGLGVAALEEIQAVAL
jgi:siroheme synthase